MTSVIYKYRVHPFSQRIEMPEGARLLHAAGEGGDVFVWAQVDPDAPLVSRECYPVATGADAPEDHTYLGTAHVKFEGTEYVWHVFDGGES